MANELIVISNNDIIEKTELFYKKREEIMNSLQKAKKIIGSKEDEQTGRQEFYKSDFGRLIGTNKDVLFNKGAMKLIKAFNLIFNFETQLSGNNVVVKAICYVKGDNTPISVGLAGGNGIKDKEFNKGVQMARIRSQKVALRYALDLQDDLTQDLDENYWEEQEKSLIGKTKVANIINWLKKADKKLREELSLELLSILKLNHNLDISFETFKNSTLSTISKLTNNDYELLKVKMIDLA